MRKFDPSRHLTSPEAIAAYLNETLKMDDTEAFISALGDVAKAQGMSEIAKRAGVRRESLYKSLSSDGNPQFSTIIKVLNALDVEFDMHPVHSEQPIYA
ncbi:addiction module antidote protein [Alloscardovia macacae]|nr:addiction module antidote protein [Alloscardovia macacae]